MTYYNIKQNLQTIIALNTLVYAPATTEIADVFINLSSTDKKDNGIDGFNWMFFDAMSTLIDIDNPALPFISMILSGVLNLYNTDPKKPDLLRTFAGISERYLQTYQLINTDLTTIMNDPVTYQYTTYTIPDGLQLPAPFTGKKTICINDLSGVQIPQYGTDAFNNYQNAFLAGFQYALTKQQLPTIGGYSVGGFEVNNYWADTYVMAMPPNAADTYTWTDGQYSIDDNDLSSAPYVTINGASMDDFERCAGQFCAAVGGVLVVPIARTSTSITYIKIYMLQGFELEERDGWYLGAASFYNWLFIDDGFGNVINTAGVANRNDVFRNWGIQYGNQIPPAV